MVWPIAFSVQEARRTLTFRPNSSLTRAAGRLRYGEARGSRGSVSRTPGNEALNEGDDARWQR